MNTALGRRLPTPNHDVHPHIPHQQFWMNVAQQIEDFHCSPLIVDQSAIHRSLQLICGDVDVIRIIVIK